MTGFVLLCVGAAVGAPARYLTDRAVQSRHGAVVPWGTVVVNVVGSFVLGVVMGLARGHQVPEGVVLAVGTGFCGALTTYSTFGYETFRLLEGNHRRYAVLNVAVSLVAGLGAALLGTVLGAAL